MAAAAVGAAFATLAPGDAVRFASVLAAALALGAVVAPPDAVAWRVLYHSTDLRGAPMLVSGVVVAPRAPAPPGGRTIVSWGHPTTGIAQRCAPSLGPDPFDLIEGLRAAVASVAASPDVRGLLIRANGRAVSGGVDVHLFEPLTSETGAALWRSLFELIHQLESLPVPTVFAAHAASRTTSTAGSSHAGASYSSSSSQVSFTAMKNAPDATSAQPVAVLLRSTKSSSSSVVSVSITRAR